MFLKKNAGKFSFDDISRVLIVGVDLRPASKNHVRVRLSPLRTQSLFGNHPGTEVLYKTSRSQ